MTFLEELDNVGIQTLYTIVPDDAKDIQEDFLPTSDIVTKDQAHLIKMYPKRIIGEVKDGEMLKMKVSITELDKFTTGINVITIPTYHNSVNHHVVKFNHQTNCHILFR